MARTRLSLIPRRDQTSAVEVWEEEDGSIVTYQDGKPLVAATIDPVTGGGEIFLGTEVGPLVRYVIPSGLMNGADATTINAIIADVSAKGGGTVILLGGATTNDYYASGIELKSNVTLKGIGKGVTKIFAPAALAYANKSNIIHAAPSDSDLENFHVADMTLDFRRASQAPSTYVTDNAGNCIVVRGNNNGKIAKRFSIKNVETLNAMYHGIAVYTGSSDFDLLHNDCHHNGFRGIHVHADDGGQATKYNVSHNVIHENGVDAGEAVAPQTNNSGLFVSYSNTADMIAVGNRIWGERGIGLDISGCTGAVGDTKSAKSATFIGTVIYDCGTNCQISANAESVSIIGGSMRGANKTNKLAAATGHNIHFASDGTKGAKNITISVVQITEATHSGIAFTNSSTGWRGIVLNANHITGNGTDTTAISAGVNLHSLSGSTLSSNIINKNNNGSAAARNIFSGGSCTGNSIIGNHIGETTDTAYTELSSGFVGNLIIGNTFRRQSGTCLKFLAGADNNSYPHNILSAAVVDSGTGNTTS